MDMEQRRAAARAKAKAHLNKLSKEELVQALVDVGFVVSTKNNSPVNRDGFVNYYVSFTIDMQLSNRPTTNPTTYSLSA